MKKRERKAEIRMRGKRERKLGEIGNEEMAQGNWGQLVEGEPDFM